MVCGKCNRNNTNVVCYCNSCFQNARLNARQEGRVEGAIETLNRVLEKSQFVIQENKRSIKQMPEFREWVRNEIKRLKLLGGKE